MVSLILVWTGRGLVVLGKDTGHGFTNIGKDRGCGFPDLGTDKGCGFADLDKDMGRGLTDLGTGVVSVTSIDCKEAGHVTTCLHSAGVMSEPGPPDDNRNIRRRLH